MFQSLNFYGNGNIMEVGYEDDLGKQGVWLFYNKNGSLFKEEEYLNNTPNGRFVRYHENGTIAYETLLVNGLHDGRGASYYENGVIEEEWYYEKGAYFPVNYWAENGEHLLKNGTGKKPFVFGVFDEKIVEQYFENGKFVKEVVVKDDKWSRIEFIPDSGDMI